MVFLHHIGVLYVKWHQNRMAGIRKPAKNDQKTANFEFFSIFSKKVETSQLNFSSVILHHARFINRQWQHNFLAVTLETHPEVAEK